MARWTFAATCITVIYLVGLASLLIVRWEEMIKLDLNALGDFAAGVFGPLAFTWLVVGYVQQGKSIKKNAEDLNDSVAELKRQADTARDRLDFEREGRQQQFTIRKKRLRPIFRVKVLGYDFENQTRQITFEVTNSGSDVRGVKFSVEDEGQVYPVFQTDSFNSGTTQAHRAAWPILTNRDMHNKKIDFVFEASYLDADFDAGSVRFGSSLYRTAMTQPYNLLITELSDNCVSQT